MGRLRATLKFRGEISSADTEFPIFPIRIAMQKRAEKRDGTPGVCVPREHLLRVIPGRGYLPVFGPSRGEKFWK